MRKIIVTEFLSLDGVMQAPGDPDEDRSGGFAHGGWHMPYFDEVAGSHAAQAIAETDAYLFGRRTYEIMARYWPNAPEDDPFADTLNNSAKYVVSTTLDEPLEWKNSTLLKGDLREAVAALKTRAGQEHLGARQRAAGAVAAAPRPGRRAGDHDRPGGARQREAALP
jgi:dihydrofolate reductase